MLIRKFVSALSLVVLLFAGGPTFPAEAVTAGSKCVNLGAQQKTGSKTYVCTKSGSKKIWVIKKVAAPKLPQTPSPLPSPVSHKWTGPCEYDPFVPQEWKSVQAYLKSFNYCDAPYTFEVASQVTEIPKSATTGIDGLTSLSTCKIADQRTKYSPIAFSNTRARGIGPNTRFQVVPIQTLDAPDTGSSPLEEYGKYFRYIESFLEYMSDGVADVTFAVPDHYSKVNLRIKDAGIGKHGQPTPVARSFFQSAIDAVDPGVDFSKVDAIIVIIPGKSDATLLGVQPYVSGQSNEGYIHSGLSLQPISAESKLGDREFLGMQPLGVLHELFHAGDGLDDHYGNQKWQLGPDLGMANWGLMSTIKSDLLGWEKWLRGMTLDSQVLCVNSSSLSTHWIVPGGVKSTKQKLLVVPISSSKVVVIESVRAKGINYKLANQSEGALVYVVDASDIRHGYGMSLVMPEGRILEIESPTSKFLGASAPLKLGESVLVEGIQIKVLEVGAFGDVIQVVKK